MKVCQTSLLIGVLGAVAMLAGCGGGGSSTTPPPSISISLSATPSSLQAGATTSLKANVANDSNNAGVTWSVTCNSSNACGSFSAAATASGAPTTFMAPSTVPVSNTVTITATSVTNTSISASTNITITAASAPTVTLSTAPGSLQIDATTPLTANVANDSNNGGVTWAVTCGNNNACGSFSATTTASGTATAFTAPAAIPANGTVTITATSVTNTTISASTQITITQTVLADGIYVFSLTGQDSATNPPGPYFAAGAISIASGTVTGGEQDFIDLNGNVSATNLGGSVGGTADGNFEITLTGTGVGVNGTETLNGTMVSQTGALITEFDSFATSRGNLDLQAKTISPTSAGYAFTVAGLDGNSSPAPVAIGGVINVDGTGTISGSGSVFDINDGGLPAPLAKQNFAASTVTSPDGFGRVVFSLAPSAGSGIAPINLVGYIVGPGNIHLVETNDTFGGVMGGDALGQHTSTGTFSTASVSGSSFVFASRGADTNGSLQVVGVLMPNSNGSVSGTLNFNDLTGSGVQSPIAVNGSFTVDPTGRVTLSNLTNGSNLNFTVQFYLNGSGSAASISMDLSDAFSGQAFLQTGGGAFTAGSFSGNYAISSRGFDSSNKLEFNSGGTVAVDGVGAFTGAADQSVMLPPASQTPGVSVSGTFTANANGIFAGTITGLDVTSGANMDNFAYYLVNTKKVIAIQTDSNQSTIVDFELHQ